MESLSASKTLGMQNNKDTKLIKPVRELITKLVIIARGTTRPASLTSSDIWTAESEPEGVIISWKRARRWTSPRNFAPGQHTKAGKPRTDYQIHGVDLTHHETQTHGTPPTIIFKLSENCFCWLDLCYHPQNDHDGDKTKDVQCKENILQKR